MRSIKPLMAADIHTATAFAIDRLADDADRQASREDEIRQRATELYARMPADSNYFAWSCAMRENEEDGE